MNCCKVPIKISGFSGGCAKVTDTNATIQASITLDAITTGNFVSNLAITNLGYLGLKCVNIACPPALNVADNLTSLALFLDEWLTQVGTYRSSNITDVGGAVDGSSATKAGIAALIAGCGDCCSQ
jgi:hypothetical protein